MCSRYELNSTAREVAARWGLEVAWSKRPLINARAEIAVDTAIERPARLL